MTYPAPIGAWTRLVLPAAAENSPVNGWVAVRYGTAAIYYLFQRGANPALFWRYDPVTATWTDLGTTPTGFDTRASMAGVRLGNRLYFYAASGAPGSWDPDPDFRSYDVVAGTWQTHPLPTVPYRPPSDTRPAKVGGVGLAVAGGLIYAFGGLRDRFVGEASNDNTLNTVFSFDPATNTWTARGTFTWPAGHVIDTLRDAGASVLTAISEPTGAYVFLVGGTIRLGTAVADHIRAARYNIATGAIDQASSVGGHGFRQTMAARFPRSTGDVIVSRPTIQGGDTPSRVYSWPTTPPIGALTELLPRLETVGGGEQSASISYYGGVRFGRGYYVVVMNSAGVTPQNRFYVYGLANVVEDEELPPSVEAPYWGIVVG